MSDSNNVVISQASAAALLSAMNAIVAQLVILNDRLSKTSSVDVTGQVKVVK